MGVDREAPLFFAFSRMQPIPNQDGGRRVLLSLFLVLIFGLKSVYDASLLALYSLAPASTQTRFLWKLKVPLSQFICPAVLDTNRKGLLAGLALDLVFSIISTIIFATMLGILRKDETRRIARFPIIFSRNGYANLFHYLLSVAIMSEMSSNLLLISNDEALWHHLPTLWMLPLAGYVYILWRKEEGQARRIVCYPDDAVPGWIVVNSTDAGTVSLGRIAAGPPRKNSMSLDLPV